MGKMENYRKTAEQIQSEMEEKVKTAEEMREEIEEFKSEMRAIPDGLDDSVATEIKAAENASRQKASGEIGKVVDTLNEQEKKAQDVEGSVNDLIAKNEQSVRAMEGMRTNRFASGVDRAINEANKNSKLGDDVIKEMNRRAEEARRAAEDAVKGI